MENLNSYSQILTRIEVARLRSARTDSVELIAVSKFQSLEKMLSIYHQGQRVFGENYVQELIGKKREVEEKGIHDLDFHFIGSLQRNKVKLLIPHVSTIHSIDSLSLLREVEKHTARLQKQIKVYLQVNIDHEETKSGFMPEALAAFLDEWTPSTFVSIEGLMAIPDPDENSAQSFERLRQLSISLQPRLKSGLSMGMSSDFEIAIEKGSTSVRIGSALFGNRG